LDGYQFEIATAKVLELHRFNPTLTGGPADGGIDIEVDRDGVRGVVQCKAHAAPVGPHAIRDLFGVIHDSGAGFGIVASPAGFTTGAVEFAKGKPIFLIDATDLVAMAEGKDVFDSLFTNLAET
jgi:restriction system protein